MKISHSKLVISIAVSAEILRAEITQVREREREGAKSCRIFVIIGMNFRVRGKHEQLRTSVNRGHEMKENDKGLNQQR